MLPNSVFPGTAPCWRALAAALLGALFFVRPVLAAGQIVSIDPAQVKQGETVLLTLQGAGLPQGSLAVEFFPQQIAVLSILSASDKEVVIQAKISSLAPPGQYNLVLYNQLGDEVTASGLLTVGSTVSAPLFSGYEPREVTGGAQAVAFLLSGTMVTPEAVAQLRMEWQAGSIRLESLDTVFSYVDPRTAVATVSGPLPAGMLRGRVLLNNTPIYLVEVMSKGVGALILGHSPTRFSSADQQLDIRLLAGEVSPLLVGRLTATLTMGEQAAPATEIRAGDRNSVIALFGGPLAAGTYVLSVLEAGAVVYGAEVEVVAPPQASVPPEGLPPAGSQLGEVAPPSAREGQADRHRFVGGNSGPADTASAEADGKAGVLAAKDGPGEPPHGPGELVSDFECGIERPPQGQEPLTLSISSRGDLRDLHAIQVSLSVGGERLENVLSAVREARLICVFAPPQGGWREGGEALLLLRDAEGLTVVEPIDLGLRKPLGAANKSGLRQQASDALDRAARDGMAETPPARTGGFTLSAAGIQFELELPPGLEGNLDWSTLTATSSNPLLEANLSSLAPQLASSANEGRRVGILMQRDPEKIEDAAWAVLCELLMEAGDVSLVVTLPGSGGTQELIGPSAVHNQGRP